MTQPPGPPDGDPPEENRPGFEPPYVPPPHGPPPQYGPPPVGPPGGYPGPPYGPRPYGPPPESRMKPPWRSAAPGEKGKYVGFTILGFAAPWLMVAIAVLLGFLFDSDSTGDLADVAPWLVWLLIMVAGVMDLAGLVLAFAPENRTVRSLGWGAIIAFLTHVIAIAIGILVLFGWCVSYLNSNTA